MQNIIQHQTQRWLAPKKKSRGRSANIQWLYRPEIVARDGRYVAYSNKVICDCYTGLEWLAGPDRDMSWRDGCTWVQGLTTGGGDWRLPTLEELRGLHKMNKNGDNISPLFNTSMTDIWSCEIHDESSAWGFNFLPGNQFRTGKGLSRRFRVFAVRQRKYHAFEKRGLKIPD